MASYALIEACHLTVTPNSGMPFFAVSQSDFRIGCQKQNTVPSDAVLLGHNFRVWLPSRFAHLEQDICPHNLVGINAQPASNSLVSHVTHTQTMNIHIYLAITWLLFGYAYNGYS